MAGLGNGQIRVRVVRMNKRPLEYVRCFAGWTVKEAIYALSKPDHPQGLPASVFFVRPYYVGKGRDRQEVKYASERILKSGETLWLSQLYSVGY